MLKPFFYTFALSLAIVVALSENHRARLAAIETQMIRNQAKAEALAHAAEMDYAKVIVRRADRQTEVAVNYVNELVARINQHRHIGDCYSTSLGGAK